ncbi:MAG: DUF1634 domain-containing protein [Bryobacteraceae bacterium]
MPAQSAHSTGLTDKQVDEVIGLLLRYGVLLAAAVVAAGGVWYLIQYGLSAPGYHVFRSEPEDLRHLSGIVTGIPGFHCRRMMQLGLLLLIATPVARVAFSVVAFFLQRDHKYVVITLIVLAVLLFSLTGRVSG